MKLLSFESEHWLASVCSSRPGFMPGLRTHLYPSWEPRGRDVSKLHTRSKLGVQKCEEISSFMNGSC